METMETGERMRGAGAPPPSSAGPGGPDDTLALAGRQARDLLAAGRSAIDQVLSFNSERFLTANRQAGGQ